MIELNDIEPKDFFYRWIIVSNGSKSYIGQIAYEDELKFTLNPSYTYIEQVGMQQVGPNQMAPNAMRLILPIGLMGSEPATSISKHGLSWNNVLDFTKKDQAEFRKLLEQAREIIRQQNSSLTLASALPAGMARKQ